MEGQQHHHLHHHHQQQQQQQHQHHLNVPIDTGGVGVAGDRVPQWTVQETREFLSIRAELDQTFMETKRNKNLWEVISNKMKEKGYYRSSDQCKCKWKNLVTRYKGSETMEADTMRQQFPFYNELQAIFAARMQRMLWLEAEGGGASGSMKKRSGRLSSDDDDDNEESEEEKSTITKKRKRGKNIANISGSSSTNIIGNLQEVLEEFMKQQMQLEMQWREAREEREEERRIKETEWRQRMEALERERLMMDRNWREREEQRRVIEEERAAKRDALITALLNKLRREDM